ncbi:hypothetical protein [Mycolicibacterium hodleri]|uniref:Uncharacterized protein n=1 Tax=Mycolicibacterium hodleri TaxID=49897 RepID=A0A502EKY7_9MYCO|nr:hypothetical protein [Mycolicibacterium hodleri]TPG36971.1 hypothetical protein EAH80_03575 [Mycolicibacterium hodleri]
MLAADYFIAVNQGDLDKVFDELTAPDFRATSRSRSVFGDRSAAEFRASMQELAAMVASSRSWASAVCYLSPACCVIRMEREAVGADGEQYTWTRVNVDEVRDGRLASLCEFDLEDEKEAFAFAEELVAAQPSRLAVSNLATQRERRVCDLVGRPEFDAAALAFMHEEFRIVDRRAMSGAPFIGREAGLANLRRLLVDYPDLDIVPLAVRGERLALVEYRGCTPGGYEATYLNVNEVDDNGQIVEQVRFDGGDFESAYRELEQRYYAGEGAAFASGGAVSTDVVIALNRGDFDMAFGDLVAAADYRVTSRSRSVFGDRSAAETRASLEELAAMVASVRMWFSTVRWLSPTCCVVRQERKACGHDGEEYSWTRLYRCEFRGGRVASMCQFELENDEEAFDYAEQLVRAATPRPAIT